MSEPSPTPPAYSRRINSEKSVAIYTQILHKLSAEKRYREAGYTARRLAAELGIDVRTVSTVLAANYGHSFCTLINSLRLREACRMLASQKYAQYNVEDIGLMAGFASRQSYYQTFVRQLAVTPRRYRLAHMRQPAPPPPSSAENKDTYAK